MSHAVRLHMCQVYVCTAQDVVLCVGQASLPVSCYGCFVAGALRRSHTEGQQPPNPNAVAAPATWTELLGAPAERVPDCSSYLSRIPWSAADSGLAVPARASPALLNASAAGESTAAGSLKAASLNASAASESTTAGGLEAFSQGTAGAERIENASSKFRRNPSPLLPFYLD